MPPWSRFSFLFPPPVPEKGARLGLNVHWGPLHFPWLLEYRDISASTFQEVQVRGPFKSYTHSHRVIARSEESCRLEEEIDCQLHCPWLHSWLDEEFRRLCRWRHAVLREDLSLFSRYAPGKRRILLSGAHGFIGSQLKILLQTAGHCVVNLQRGSGEKREDAIFWQPDRGFLCKEDFEDFDAVIHLAGENIASGFWTRQRKEKIFLSRARDTWLLSQVLCRLYRPPQTVISASAIGFYGNRGQESLTEESGRGIGFLPDLCTKWERATEAIEQRGSRVVHPRFGMVLSRRGGALVPLLRAYQLGLGGRWGSGKQILSWIGIDDAMGALYHLLMDETLSGGVNLVSPKPLPQMEFAKTLAKKLHRPTLLPLSRGFLRFFFRGLADEVFLASAHAVPAKLLHSGYRFRYPDLDTALDFVI